MNENQNQENIDFPTESVPEKVEINPVRNSDEILPSSQKLTQAVTDTREQQSAISNGIKKDYLTPACMLLAAALISASIFYNYTKEPGEIKTAQPVGKSSAELESEVTPSAGIILPVKWGDLGVKMISVGVIDKQKLEKLYTGRGGLSPEDQKMLEETNNGNIKITPHNAGFILNLFWALGLGNKNDILDNGPMMTYDGQTPASRTEALAKAKNFASTGGWTLASDDPMEHYSRHPFINLTPEQQKLVENTSKNIYRPCCNNPTHFPDCNHGLAMLGFLELMAAQGVSETEMYKAALQLNSYWFTDTYLTIAQYLASKGVSWDEVNPKEILGASYSSGSGYQKILSQVTAPAESGGGGCGI